MLPYVEPGQLVDIGGRRINLNCTGAGGPTVVLMAGIFSWSVVWYKTQPVIAQKTRVCAFDRAGYGFSDPGPRPQILSDVVDDLHAALNAGPIPGPYVLVGHSLGGIEARLYAQRWPKEVVGMVLVDTALAGEGLIDENQPGFDEVIGGESYAADMLHCAFLVVHGYPLSPSRSRNTMAARLRLPCRATRPPRAENNVASVFTAYYFADKVLGFIFVRCIHTVTTASIIAALAAIPLVVLLAEETPGGKAGHRGGGESVWFHPILLEGLDCSAGGAREPLFGWRT